MASDYFHEGKFYKLVEGDGACGGCAFEELNYVCGASPDCGDTLIFVEITEDDNS